MGLTDGQRELFDAAEVGPRLKRTGGYAARPGSGPAGETCRSCRHYARLPRGRRVYRKCRLIAALWRWSERTEIRATAPACERWKRPPKRRGAKGGGQWVRA